jgi:hypothetical protein
MTTRVQAARLGCDLLRLVVRNMDSDSETFNQRFTAEQLLQIGRMHLDSEWELPPSHWAPRQVREALRGIVPTWDDRERPTYARSPRRTL